jgi:hypothetical protein
MRNKVLLAVFCVLLLAGGGYAAAQAVVTELHPYSQAYTERVTIGNKNRTQIFTVTGTVQGTITDQDTLPDPVTVTSPPVTVTVTTGTTTSEPPPTTTTNPPPPPPPTDPEVELRQPDGGAGFYGNFANPLPTDPSYFPIGTWGSYNTTQANRDSDAAAGLNLYVWLADPCGLGTQVNGDPRFRVLYDQGENRSCLGSATSGWMLGDEVDMCCGPPGYAGGNGYNMLTERNASLPSDNRIRYTNYGKGVMFWETDQQAAQFVNLPFLNVVSNDIYWFTDPNERSRAGYRVAASYGDTVARMRFLDGMDGARTPIWNFVESGWPFTESASAGGRAIAPAELRAAVWHSLIAGARGIIWFQHSFGGPCTGDHHTIRSNCHGTRAAVAAVNAQVKSIAPALNGPTLTSGFAAAGAVRASARWDGSNFYILAGAATNAGSQASFSLPCVGDATATVLGEGRSIPVTAGAFADDFADGLAVHVYKIDGGSRCGL